MIVRNIAAFFALMLMSTASLAQSDREPGSALEVALSNDTLQLRYIAGGEMVGVKEGEFSGTFFLSEERDIVLSAALLFPLSLQIIDRLELKVGPQIYAALLDEENDDVMSATLGLEARYLLIKDLGLAISGQAFYGPDILTFGSADNLTDLSARVEIGVADRLIAFAGMRWFEFDLTDGSGTRTLQEEVFVGAQFRF